MSPRVVIVWADLSKTFVSCKEPATYVSMDTGEGQVTISAGYEDYFKDRDCERPRIVVSGHDMVPRSEPLILLELIVSLASVRYYYREEH